MCVGEEQRIARREDISHHFDTEWLGIKMGRN
jgi:hypothetical protein